MSSSPALRTRLSAIPFSARCLASQWLPWRLSLLPFGSRPLPPGFRFRFRLLSLGSVPFSDTSQPLRFSLVRSDLGYIIICIFICQHLFSKFFEFFIFFILFILFHLFIRIFHFRYFSSLLSQTSLKPGSHSPIIVISPSNSYPLASKKFSFICRYQIDGSANFPAIENKLLSSSQNHLFAV